MRKITIVGSILLPAALFAQAPAPAPAPQAPAPAAQAPKETSAAAASAGAGRVAVVDFQKAVVENAEGKKAQERRSEEHTSELQSLAYLVCRLLLEKKKIRQS